MINTLKLYVKAFSNSMPTGKVNTFANQTLPQLTLLNLRVDRPVNLVNAFEKPVKSTDGYAYESINRVFDADKEVEKFVKEPAASYYLLLKNQDIDTNSEKAESLKDLLQRLASDLETLLD